MVSNLCRVVQLFFSVSFTATYVGKCSTWPKNQIYGCSSKGDWKILKSNISISDYTKCEKLCLLELQDGCCFLNNGSGCYWKPGAIAVAGLDSLSVTCSKRGRGYIIVNVIDNNPDEIVTHVSAFKIISPTSRSLLTLQAD